MLAKKKEEKILSVVIVWKTDMQAWALLGINESTLESTSPHRFAEQSTSESKPD